MTVQTVRMDMDQVRAGMTEVRAVLEEVQSANKRQREAYDALSHSVADLLRKEREALEDVVRKVEAIYAWQRGGHAPKSAPQPRTEADIRRQNERGGDWRQLPKTSDAVGPWWTLWDSEALQCTVAVRRDTGEVEFALAGGAGPYRAQRVVRDILRQALGA